VYTVGAVLENEAISGLTTGKQSGLRRSSKVPGKEEVMASNPETLIKTVSIFLVLSFYQIYCVHCTAIN